MNNAQRFVFSSLVAVILLEFGSFTKIQKIWSLAFNNATTTTAQTSSNTNNSNGTITIIPNAHPTNNAHTV